MADCNLTKYPMDPKKCITNDECGVVVDCIQFKSMIGGLRYLVHTRPDIAYSVGIVSRFTEKPTLMHQNATKCILQYVKGTLGYGLIYMKTSGNNVLTGYSDNDLAGHIEDRKSTITMAFHLNESLVTWVSQKQRCIALSSCEEEFMAATAVACQAVWLRKLLSQVTSEEVGPVVIFIDNISAIDLAKNPVFHGRSKHIDIRYHFICECVEKGEIIVQHIRTDMQRRCFDKSFNYSQVRKDAPAFGSQGSSETSLD
ncbi:secreted RxLR effector protein 161-like [Apium graveolens]|uniref:secreted RxLR effector protein 161-like n=1 Tax=Apium graveolens TaxID=4045 RepID=UPI003D7AE974